MFGYRFRRVARLARIGMAASILAGSVALQGAPTTRAQVVDLPDLAVTISRSAAAIGLQERVNFTYTIRNVSTSRGASGVQFAGLISNVRAALITEQPDGQPLCGLSITGNDRQLSCNDMILGAGQSAILEVAVDAFGEPGTISTSGSVDPDGLIDEVSEGNNSASRSVSVLRRPDLRAFVEGPTIVEAGARIQLEMVIRNDGGSTSSALNSSSVLAKLSSTAPLDYESITFVGDRQGFTCDIKEPLLARNRVECSGGQLGEGESMTVLVGARVKARAPFSSKDREITAEVDPNNTIVETSEGNNKDTDGMDYD